MPIDLLKEIPDKGNGFTANNAAQGTSSNSGIDLLDRN